MANKNISPELWADFKEIQASMAIEGFEVSDQDLAAAAQSYLHNPIPQKLKELKAKADREGRSFADVVSEELNLGLHFHRES